MSEEIKKPVAGKQKSSWLKKILYAFVALIVLVIAVFFVGTSGAFIKGFILPKVASSLKADLKADEVSLSPFSQLVLKNVTLTPEGAEQLATIKEVRVRYSLMKIIGGDIDVSEVTIDTPTITVSKVGDAPSNLDVLLKNMSSEEPAKPATSSAPPKLNVRNIALKNATLRQITKTKSGETTTAEISNLNLSLDQLRLNEAGKLTIASAIKYETPAKDQLNANLNGAFDVTLNDKFMPSLFKGNLKLGVAQATGAFAELAQSEVVLNSDLSATEIKDLSIQLIRQQKTLGQIRISGPLNIETLDAKLALEINNVDHNALNLVGATMGMDFTTTTINAKSNVELSQNATQIAANGNLAINKLAIKKDNLTTPAMDVKLDYQVKVDNNKQSALIEKFALSMQQGGKEIVRGTLDRPMNFAFGGTSTGFQESAFQLVITQFNLADWRAFAGDAVQAGLLDANLKLLALQDGKALQFTLDSKLTGVALNVASNAVSNLGITLNTGGKVDNFDDVRVDNYTFALTHNNAAALSANGNATYKVATGEATAQVTASAALATLTRIVPTAGLDLTKGNLNVNTTVGMAGKKTTSSGKLSVQDLIGKYDAYVFNGYQTDVDWNVELNETLVTINQAKVALAQGAEKGGSLEVQGKVDTDTLVGDITYKADGLNQNGLRPFLAGVFGDKLVSIALNTTGSAKLNGATDAALKSDIVLSNLVVKDATGKIPAKALEAKLKIDGALVKETVTLNTVTLGLSPTARAKNELVIHGMVPLNPTNTAPGTLTIQAESLDVTPFYDLLTANPNTNVAAATPVPAPAPATTNAPVEPAPIELPFKQFTAKLDINQFYLREVAISNWVTTVTINQGKVSVNPLQLTLNGAPVTGNIQADVSVPGYTYDVNLKADKIPLEPIANSFSPDYKGQAQGNILANIQIKGAGITDASLQKNLGGAISLNFTNANIQVVGPRMKMILTPIALLLRVQEIMQSPLNSFGADLNIAQGKINVTQLIVESEAFEAKTAGIIPMSEVLTNSPLNFPINLSLRRSLAQKSNLLAANTPEDAKYSPLPAFAKVTGTIGTPITETDKLVISGMLLKSAVGIPGAVGGKAGDVLQGIGGFLTGEKKTDEKKEETTPTLPNPFDLFKKPTPEKKP